MVVNFLILKLCLLLRIFYFIKDNTIIILLLVFYSLVNLYKGVIKFIIRLYEEIILNFIQRLSSFISRSYFKYSELTFCMLHIHIHHKTKFHVCNDKDYGIDALLLIFWKITYYQKPNKYVYDVLVSILSRATFGIFKIVFKIPLGIYLMLLLMKNSKWRY